MENLELNNLNLSEQNNISDISTDFSSLESPFLLNKNGQESSTSLPAFNEDLDTFDIAASSIVEPPYNDIFGTARRDSLVGTSAQDRITGGFAADIIFGGLGSDTFVYDNVRDAGDTIKDFELRTDVIDLTDVLNSFGYNGSNPIADGYIQFSAYSRGTTVLLDSDGSGRLSARPYIKVEKVTTEELSSFPGHFLPKTEEPPENQAPTDLILTPVSTPENVADNSTIATFSTTDPDANDTHTYSLVTGEGDVDNTDFTIVDNELRINESADFETKSSYSIRVQTTDAGGLNYQEIFSISVIDVNEAPTDILVDGNSVKENTTGAVIGDISVIDPDTIAAFVDNTVTVNDDRFEVVDNNGTLQLKLKDDRSLDYQIETNVPLTLIATDKNDNNLTYSKDFTINVSQVIPLVNINASLANDTGASDSDGITLDPTINGQASGATSLRGNLNGNGFIDISDALKEDGNFTISLEQYEVLSNSSLPDGNYILELKAGNDSGGESDVITVNFTLDCTPPPIDFDLAPQSDTGELGDKTTTERIVTLVGQTEPGLEMVLVETQQMVTADSDGNFSLTDVPMPIAGTAAFSLATVDIAGNLGRVQKQFTRIGINGAPEIISTPETVFDTDEQDTYTYQIEAVDPDNDTLTYSLLNGLQGVEIDERGLLTFEPEGNLRPSYDFNIEVSDGRGGTDTQAFTVEIPGVVIDNRPPAFTSTPIFESSIGEEYSYQPTATDPDGDSLTFSLIEGIPGLNIEAETGLLLWNPTVEQLGDNSVIIQVSDEEGLTDTQSFTISVQDIATNAAPIFISDPVTDFSIAVPNTATGDVNPELISLNLSDGETATESVSITLPGGGTSTGGQADVVFVVDESGSMNTEHEWLTNMVLELDSALQDRGITDNRYSLIGYTDETRLLNLPTQNQVSVYGPGNQLIGSNVIDNPQLVFDLLADGTYSVTIGSPGTAVPFEYDLNAALIDTPAIALTNFNTPFTATIAPQTEETFSFDAPAGAQILFDDLSSSASNDISVRLVDPNGNNVFRNSRFNQNTRPYLLSESGTYSLIINGGNAGGDFSFQLLEFNSAATEIALDTEITGTITTSLETKVFQFDATGGQQLYFDSAGNQDIRAAVYGADNQQLGNSFSLRDFTAIVPTDGTYTLILQSDSTNAVDYNFRLVTPEIEQTTLVIGDVATGTLGEAGEEDVYLIEGTAGQRIWFDGLKADSRSIVGRLISPAGIQIFSNTRSDRNSGAIILPDSGTYSLVISGTDETGDYSFQLLDLATNAINITSQVAAEAEINVTFDSGLQTKLYEFNGTAGQQLVFDSLSTSGSAISNWQLHGPDNAIIAQAGITSDFAASLPADGTYTLVLGGNSSSPFDLTFKVSKQVVEEVTIDLSDTIIGDTISGTLTEAGEQDIYKFSATAGQRLLFDGLGSTTFKANARLVSPTGVEVLRNTTSNFDSRPFILTESGEYSLIVSANDQTDDYSFRLLDLDAGVTSINLDTVVNGTILSGLATEVYQFVGSAGQELFFNTLNNTGSLLWTLLGPSNADLGSKSFSQNFLATLPADATYTLLLDSNSNTSVDFSFEIVTTQKETKDFNYNEVVTGTISEPGETDIYQFTGVAGQQIWFDGIESTDSDIEVALVSPSGDRIFQRLDIDQDSSTLFTLAESGQYFLVINNDTILSRSVIGDYSFQVLEITPNLTLPNDITGTFNRLDDWRVFQFEGVKGQQFSIKPNEGLFGTAAQISDATSFLSINQGGTEDGYLGIDTALGLPFRDGAAANIILVTDEAEILLTPI